MRLVECSHGTIATCADVLCYLRVRIDELERLEQVLAGREPLPIILYRVRREIRELVIGLVLVIEEKAASWTPFVWRHGCGSWVDWRSERNDVDTGSAGMEGVRVNCRSWTNGRLHGGLRVVALSEDRAKEVGQSGNRVDSATLQVLMQLEAGAMIV